MDKNIVLFDNGYGCKSLLPNLISLSEIPSMTLKISRFPGEGTIYS